MPPESHQPLPSPQPLSPPFPLAHPGVVYAGSSGLGGFDDPPDESGFSFNLDEGQDDVTRLTPREKEIIFWIQRGKPDWQIAQILAISHKTVNYHVEQFKRKLNAATRVQAVVLASRLGLLDHDQLAAPPPLPDLRADA